LHRRIDTIARVAGLDPDGNYGLADLLNPPHHQGE
jgi:type IV secretion system protein VirB11